MPDIRTGIVTSVGKMAKTITVTTRQMVVLPKYKISRPRTTKFLVHDETSQAREGDKVSIIHGKPFSKRKHYSLYSIDSRKTIYPSTTESNPQVSQIESTST